MLNKRPRPTEVALARYTTMGPGRARVIRLIERSPMRRLIIPVGTKDVILKLDAEGNVTVCKETATLLRLGEKGYSDEELITAINQIAGRTQQPQYKEEEHGLNTFYR